MEFGVGVEPWSGLGCRSSGGASAAGLGSRRRLSEARLCLCSLVVSRAYSAGSGELADVGKKGRARSRAELGNFCFEIGDFHFFFIPNWALP
ncbi:hypothetical protein C2S51_002088 [Perilla frutescens var. frutescens]|nr:hypothetical protein C2S51_002088 [Perilla frutescens var. frutescens]